jgi:hypothetical protein
MIDEYGTSSDKALLETILAEKNGVVRPKKTGAHVATRPAPKKKTARTR